MKLRIFTRFRVTLHAVAARNVTLRNFMCSCAILNVPAGKKFKTAHFHASAEKPLTAPACPANATGTPTACCTFPTCPLPNFRRANVGYSTASLYPASFNKPLWIRSHAKQVRFALAPVSSNTPLRPIGEVDTD